VVCLQGLLLPEPAAPGEEEVSLGWRGYQQDEKQELKGDMGPKVQAESNARIGDEVGTGSKAGQVAK
jgi:hypothetical protein